MKEMMKQKKAPPTGDQPKPAVASPKVTFEGDPIPAKKKMEEPEQPLPTTKPAIGKIRKLFLTNSKMKLLLFQRLPSHLMKN